MEEESETPLRQELEEGEEKRHASEAVPYRKRAGMCRNFPDLDGGVGDGGGERDAGETRSGGG